MWDKLNVRERERMGAVLFVSILAAICCYSLLAMDFPYAAQGLGGVVLGAFSLFAMRRLVALRQRRWGAAPIGPLSPDERSKARSKLLKAGRQTPYCR